jgi:thioredoxin
LVDFYADWCGPCRKQGKILLDMERSASQNHAYIIKVNIDRHRQLADEFEVSSLPTLMLIKNGKVIDRQTGVADHQEIAALLAR